MNPQWELDVIAAFAGCQLTGEVADDIHRFTVRPMSVQPEHERFVSGVRFAVMCCT